MGLSNAFGREREYVRDDGGRFAETPGGGGAKGNLKALRDHGKPAFEKLAAKQSDDDIDNLFGGDDAAADQSDEDIDSLFGGEEAAEQSTPEHAAAQAAHEKAIADLATATDAFNAAREARRANSKDPAAVKAYNDAAKAMNAANQAVQAAKAEVEKHGPKAPIEQNPDMIAHFGENAPTQEKLNANYGLKGSNFQNEITVKPAEFGVQFEGKIIDKTTGEAVVTQFARTVIRGEDGTLTVRHEHLATNPAYPSAGREIISNSTKEHYEMGVRRIEVKPEGGGHGLDFDAWQAKTAEYKAAKAAYDQATAAHKSGTMDPATYKQHADAFKARVSEGGDLHSGYIGPYVWASSGFKWSDNDANTVGDSYMNYLMSEHGMPLKEAGDHAEAVKSDPKRMLSHKVNGKPVGAHFMQQRLQRTEEPWKLDMTKGDPAWEHYKATYGLAGIDADQGA